MNNSKPSRPENAKYGTIYLISDLKGRSYKIGITLNWDRRSRQLEIGTKTRLISQKIVKDPGRLEKILHRKYDSYRLPQSEWFILSEEQVQEVKVLIGNSSKSYKQVFKSREKKMIDLEMAAQDDPEMLEFFKKYEHKKN